MEELIMNSCKQEFHSPLKRKQINMKRLVKKMLEEGREAKWGRVGELSTSQREKEREQDRN